MRSSSLFAGVVLGVLSCARPPTTSGVALQSSTVLGPKGQAADVRELARGARATVLVFFAKHCDCLDEHDARIKALYETYGPRGVRFFMVDSEAGASPERDRLEATHRGYLFPILVDRGARLADQLEAEYATYSVVIDDAGSIRYRGGIDSDRAHLRPDATPLLAQALDDVLSGSTLRVARGKTLGCTLQKW